jgi:hypothetical protein
MAFGWQRGGAALLVVEVLSGAPRRVASRHEVFALLLRVKAGAAAPGHGGSALPWPRGRQGMTAWAAVGRVLEHRGFGAWLASCGGGGELRRGRYFFAFPYRLL